MTPRALRAGYRRVSRTAVVAVGLLLLLAACLLPTADQPLLTTARFPHVTPKRLAHLLADFSTHLLLYPHLGEWSIEEESSNYTAWRYTVSYSCGARCSGRAAVLALDEHHEQHERHEHHELRPGEVEAAGRHAAPRSHTVRVAHRSCTPLLPILTWPHTCEDWETETFIGDDGSGGAVMRERARSTCGGAGSVAVLRALLPLGCAGGLRSARDQHLQRLRAILTYSDA